MSEEERVQKARDGLGDALAYLKGVLTQDHEAVDITRSYADPLALADALAFILIGRSDADDLLTYVDDMQRGLLHAQDSLGHDGPHEE